MAAPCGWCVTLALYLLTLYLRCKACTAFAWPTKWRGSEWRTEGRTEVTGHQ